MASVEQQAAAVAIKFGNNALSPPVDACCDDHSIYIIARSTYLLSSCQLHRLQMLRLPPLPPARPRHPLRSRLRLLPTHHHCHHHLHRRVGLPGSPITHIIAIWHLHAGQCLPFIHDLHVPVVFIISFQLDFCAALVWHNRCQSVTCKYMVCKVPKHRSICFLMTSCIYSCYVIKYNSALSFEYLLWPWIVMPAASV